MQLYTQAVFVDMPTTHIFSVAGSLTSTIVIHCTKFTYFWFSLSKMSYNRYCWHWTHVLHAQTVLNSVIIHAQHPCPCLFFYVHVDFSCTVYTKFWFLHSYSYWQCLYIISRRFTTSALASIFTVTTQLLATCVLRMN